MVLFVGIEYAYKAAPRASQGTAMGLILTIMYGIGSFIALADSEEYYNFIASGILFVSTIIFFISVKCFKFGNSFTIN